MIPIYQPSILEGDVQAVAKALRRKHLTFRAPEVEQFERAFADYMGMEHAVALSSGSAALHCLMLALWRPYMTCVVPDLCYVAVPNAARHADVNKIIYADCDPETWNMRAGGSLSQGDVVILVHTLGVPCNMDEWQAFAKQRGVILIEDCAEALGSKWKGHLCGTFGAASIFSFYANKTITTGEGGMVVTNKATLAKRVRHIANHCSVATYVHDDKGFNYRMTAIQAALGLSQLARVEDTIKQKARVYSEYRKNLPGWTFQKVPFGVAADPVVWMVAVQVEDASLLANRLSFETRPMFTPHTGKPNAKMVAETTLMLPSYPGLTNEAVKMVCDELKEKA